MNNLIQKLNNVVSGDQLQEILTAYATAIKDNRNAISERVRCTFTSDVIYPEIPAASPSV